MELFILYEDTPVLQVNGLQYFILSLWTLSLLQFSLVLTSTKTRRARLSLDPNGLKLRLVTCCESELWGMSANVLMQDGPFIVLRLYCLIGLDIFSYNLMFYTAKNLLVIILQTYRIGVLLGQCHDDVTDQKQNINASMASLTAIDREVVTSNVVIATRPQPYFVDKTGKLRATSPLSHDGSTYTVDSRDLTFVTAV